MKPLKLMRLPHWLAASMQAGVTAATWGQVALARRHSVAVPNRAAAAATLAAYHPAPTMAATASESAAPRRDRLAKATCDVSVIVSCYNSETTIAACVGSVLNQPFTGKLELIVVDDGSTDGSREVLAQKRDPRLRVLVQPNAGAGASRNRGLDAARGRYLLFVDADDRLAPAALQVLWDTAKAERLDLVDGRFRQFAGQHSVVWRNHHRTLSDAAGVLRPGISGFVTGRLYRRELWRDVRFPTQYWFEDTCVIFLVLPRVRRYRQLDQVVYHYRDNPGGLSKVITGQPRALDTLYLTMALCEQARAQGVDLARLRPVAIWQLTRFAVERLAGLAEPMQAAAFATAATFVQHTPELTAVGPHDGWFVRRATAALVAGDLAAWQRLGRGWALRDKIGLRG
ncbi:glycosyltransferase family 2 protein [Lacticaseibacillus parakribbianus]|uniref:glycosyltransferase family 2 protein n=1 Tax=Lacticaseibacillus parakribbianus TaxID=2970927 RepID=UPI0021CB4915|nr:glycosyltransferase family 2 protein [Lacticaseibacillus parakribbianus]